ncbi:SDR family NAD(P)-dependent oxidoreductase [Sulfolobus sp. E11-6]|uniref:SDR family NAD(P)-dependent oxidoreductase n=1 Tax=Sulfolobus sp. E11-6 TaxID=2663020 RepID=UPI00129577DC|nr:SDR family NAD(P)-dependent oxidoreductase [Sulfolobus sp. E11-6]QGA69118.1 glucose 1-dehydrogenase [Sulfolobus sp. E11-6]
MSLKGMVSIVTGSAMGIGKEISLRLAEEGSNVVLFDIVEKVKDTLREVKDRGVDGLAIVGDVTKRVDVERATKDAIDTFGEIDILVNNAGIYPTKPFLEMTEDDWDKVLNVNLKGTFLFSRSVAKHMVQRKYGRIINISSNAAIVGFPGLAHYCASKAGVVGLTRAMALELAPYGITVNAIAPGPIETERMSTSSSQQADYQAFLRAIPVGRLGKPRDVANVVIFLASQESSFITGQLIVVDGGYTVH